MRSFVLLWMVIVAASACRTGFERIRTSGDAALMYQEANALYEKKDFTRAIILYELVIPSYRGKIEAEQLYYNYANANYQNGSYTLSSHYFKTFADTYTTSTLREDALFKSAYSYYLMSPRFRLDQSESSKAVDAFQFFANSYPNSDKIGECNSYIDEIRRKMETKSFESAKLYYHMRNYSSAIQSLENLMKDYPGSVYHEEAAYLITKASYELANESIYLRQEERYRKTTERSSFFLKKYPRSKYKDEVLSYQEQSKKELNRIQNG